MSTFYMSTRKYCRWSIFVKPSWKCWHHAVLTLWCHITIKFNQCSQMTIAQHHITHITYDLQYVAWEILNGHIHWMTAHLCYLTIYTHTFSIVIMMQWWWEFTNMTGFKIDDIITVEKTSHLKENIMFALHTETPWCRFTTVHVSRIKVS